MTFFSNSTPSILTTTQGSNTVVSVANLELDASLTEDLTITLDSAGGAFGAPSQSASISARLEAGQIILDGSAANIQAYLNSALFPYTSADAGAGIDTITMSATSLNSFAPPEAIQLDFNPAPDFSANAQVPISPTFASATANSPPVANDDTLSATEDTEVTFTAADLLGNDTDADGDTLSIASVTAGTGGTVVLNGDGTVTFTPDEDFNGPASFTYVATDGTDTSASATVTVNVAAVNDVPVANDDTLSATEDTEVTFTAADLLGNDTDADGDTLSIASVTAGTGGTVVLNGDGTVTFTPDEDFNGPASFTYVATDGTDTSASATVTVNVAAVNDDATITGVSTGAVVEAGGLDNDEPGTPTASGQLTVTDVDTGEAEFEAAGASDLQGDYGTFTFDETTGAWTYTLNPALADALLEGELAADSLTVTSLDGTATETITVDITGANDEPVGVDDNITVAEVDGDVVDAGAPSSTGNLLDNDLNPDAGALTLTSISTSILAPSQAVPNGGTLEFTLTSGATVVVGSDGSFEFFQNDIFDSLAVGETATDSFVYVFVDAQGDASTATVTFTITGTNDAPVVDVDGTTAAVSVTEIADGAADEGDADLTVTGTVAFSDVDTSNTHTAAVGVTVLDGDGVAIASPFGSLTLDPLNDAADTVGYTFTVADADIEFLAVDETLTQVYTITITDTNGATVTQDVTVTITGTNDAPTLDAGSGDATEDGDSITVDLAALGDDIDSDDDGASLTYTIDTPPSQGTASIDGTTLTFDPGSDFQSLAAGETTTVTITVQADDGSGGIVTNDVTVTITGTNDAPVIEVDDTDAAASVTEIADGDADEGATVLTDTGTVTFSDVDTSNTHTAGVGLTVVDGDGVAIASPFGSLTLDPLNDGDDTVGYTFTVADADIEFLAVDETLTQVYTITITDTNGGTVTQDVTVTITGTNDAPTLDSGSGDATEDGDPITVDLAALGDDIDSDDDGASLTYAIITDPSEGTASISGTTLTFDPGSDFQDLAEGETRQVTISIQATDSNDAVSTTEDVVVTITGTNDAPTLAAGTANAAEDGDPVDIDLAALGDDIDSDDDGTSLTYAIITDPSEGTASISGTTLTFDPGSNFQDLAEGETRQVTISIQATDSNSAVSTTENVVVTITGTNDDPVIEAVGTTTAVSVTEIADGAAGEGVDDLTVSGTVAFSDVDLSDTHTAADPVAVDAAGDPLTDTSALLGTFTLDPLDNDADTVGYTFTVSDGDVDFLGAGESIIQRYAITIDDGEGGTATQIVEVTINGTNDAPIVTGEAISVDESAPDVADTVIPNLLANESDADTNDILTITQVNGENFVGSTEIVLESGAIITIHSDGEVTLAQNGAFESLAEGDTLVLPAFDYTVSDGTDFSAGIATITITGTDDAAVVAGVTMGDVIEGDIGDDAVTVSGVITISDVDEGENPVFGDVTVTDGDNGFGSFTLVDGEWTYTLDQSAVQDLAAGEEVTDTITFIASDETEQTVTVTITGTNDDPVIEAVGTTTAVSVTEIADGAAGEGVDDLTVSGTVAFSDVDLSDTHTAAAPVAVDAAGDPLTDTSALLGTFTLGAVDDGADTVGYTFTVSDGDVDSLGADDVIIQRYAITINDGEGGTVTQIVTVTINGTDDAAVVSGDFTGAVTEGDIGDDAVTATGALSISDVDADDSPEFADVTSTVGDNAFGSFTLVDGTWTYTLNQAAVQDLDEGDEVTDTITFIASDLTEQTVTVTITGTDDAPVVAGDFTGAVTEGDIGDDAVTATGALSISDVDADDSPEFADVTSTVGDNAFGSFTLVDGTWTYTLNQAAVQDLDEGDGVTDTITFIASDLTEQTVTVTITGTDDAPVVAGDFTGAVTEGDIGDDAVTATGALSISDVDADDSPEFADVTSTVGDNAFGSFTLVDGTWTYTLNQSAVQGLEADEVVTDTITFTATDGTPQTVTVMITGTNDAPVISMAPTVVDVDEDIATAIDLSAIDLSDVDENGGLTTITLEADDGTLTATDIAGDGVTVTVSADGVVTLEGTITDLNAYIDGATNIEFLSAPNDAGLPGDSITVTVDDGNTDNATSSVRIDVNIMGINDSPVAEDDDITVFEDAGGVLTPGVLNGSLFDDNGDGVDIDVDGDTLEVFEIIFDDGTGPITLSVSPSSPAVFTLASGAIVTVNADGSFEVDLTGGTGSNLFEALAEGEILPPESIDYSVSDGNGGFSTATATFAITGTNDGPVVEAELSETAAEGDASFTVDLLAGATDVDATDTLNVDPASVTGLEAGVTFDPVTNSLSVDPTDAAFDSLGVGESRVITVTFNIIDGEGGSVAQTATVTITGTNDDPVVEAELSASAAEGDASFTVDLLAGASDVDASDTLSVDPASVDGLEAGVTFDAVTNSLSVDPTDAAFDSLGVGESRVITVTFNIIDGEGGSVAQTATVTITGTNDDPVVEAELSASAAEGDASFTVDLLAGATDVDATDTLNVDPASVTGLEAGVTFDAVTNSLSVDPTDAAFDSLGVGESRVITVTFNIIDGEGGSVAQTATVTITGTNDDPVVEAELSASAAEGDASFTVDLLAGASDVDASDTLSVDPASVDGLEAGVTFDAVTNSLSVDPTDAAFDSLGVGESRVITVTFNIIDGEGGSVAQTATVTITGTNDDPVVEAELSASAAEGDASFTVDLLAGASDVDASDTLSVDPASVDGLEAGVTFDAVTNSLSVDPTDAAFDSLGVGESRVITVTFNIIDGEGGSVAQTATVTITGTNDDPVVEAELSASAAEGDASFTVDLLAGASDVDATDVLSVDPLSVDGLEAGVTFDAVTNSLSVDPTDAAFDSLGVGESRVITVTFNIIDGEGGSVAQTATVTITGTNDDPVVEAELSASAAEGDASFTVDLLAGASDVDASDTLSVDPASVDGLEAGVTFDAVTNSLSVDPTDAAFDSLGVGESRVITVTFNIIDGEGGSVAQTATVTITGTNDDPVVEAELSASAAEGDASFTVDLLAGASDVDATDVLSVDPLSVDGLEAGVTFDAVTNSLSVDPTDAAFDSLGVGESRVITVTFNIIDGEGGSVAQTATVTITGTNDDPVVEAELSASAAEGDASFTVDLLAGASDVDASDTLSVDPASVDGLEAGVTFDAVTNSLSVDPTDAAFDSLGVGESRVITVTFNIIDGEGGSVAQTATVTITGTNDDPVVEAELSASAAEGDASFTVDLLAGASDVDATDVLSVDPLSVDGLEAGVTFDEATNSLSVDPTDAAFDSLADGETRVITVTFNIVDGEGGSVAQTATVTITGTNDAPVVEVIDPAIDVEGDAGVEDIVVIDIFNDLVTASDVDNGEEPALDNASVSVEAAAGSATLDASLITVNADGTISYDRAAFDFLAGGQSAIFAITFNIVSGPDTVSQTVTLTINGISDPSAGDDVLTGTAGDDLIDGLAGDDIIDGLDGNDTLIGGLGADVLNGGAGIDTASYQGGDEGVVIDLLNGVARRGEAEGDFLLDIENLIGTSFDDVLIGDNSNNVLTAGAGADRLNGRDGDDQLFGEDGDDVLLGADGNDNLFGGAGDDILRGGNDDDTLNGGLGADTLLGGTGNDTLDGGEGDDTLNGNNGDDTLTGGEGNDTLVGAGGDDVLSGGEGDDTLSGNSGVDELFGEAGDDTLIGGGGDDLLSGGDGGDDLFGNGGDDLLSGGEGDDDLNGGVGNDELFGDAGNDTLIGAGGADTLNGGDGDDTLFGGIGNDTLNGDDGDDTLSGSNGLDVLNGGAGNDALNGGAGGDTLRGGDDDDTLVGADGNDVLFGDDGDDTLNGGANVDILNGGAGDDRLVGGTANDTFVFDAGTGTDTIVDFAIGGDQIFLTIFSGATSFDDLVITQDGSSAIVQVVGNEDDSFVLLNTTATDLTAASFAFASSSGAITVPDGTADGSELSLFDTSVTPDLQSLVSEFIGERSDASLSTKTDASAFSDGLIDLFTGEDEADTTLSSSFDFTLL